MAGKIQFKADVSELRKLAVFWKQFVPRQAQWATSNVLNDLAFKTRTNALSVIDSNMQVRDRGFVARSIGVVKTRGNIDINRQEARTGSIARKRFSGWVEQQYGTSTKKQHIAGIGARGGKASKKVAGRYRFKPALKIRRPTDSKYKGRSTDSKENRAWRMLYMMRRQGDWFNKPFFLYGIDHRISDGVYRMTPGGKLRWIGLIKDYRNVQQLPWMTTAINKTMRKNDARKIWSKHFIKQLKRRARFK